MMQHRSTLGGTGGKSFLMLADSDSYMTLGAGSTVSAASTAHGFGSAHNKVLKVALGLRNSMASPTHSSSAGFSSAGRRASMGAVAAPPHSQGSAEDAHPLSPGQNGTGAPVFTPHTLGSGSPRVDHPIVQEVARDDETEASFSTRGHSTPRGALNTIFRGASSSRSGGASHGNLSLGAPGADGSGSAYTSPAPLESRESGYTTSGSATQSRSSFPAAASTPQETAGFQSNNLAVRSTSAGPPASDPTGFEQFDPPSKNDSPRSADRKRALFLVALSAMKLKSGAVAEPKTPAMGQASKSFHYRVGQDYGSEQQQQLKRPQSVRAHDSQAWPGISQSSQQQESKHGVAASGAGKPTRPAPGAQGGGTTQPRAPRPGHVPAYLRRWKQHQVDEAGGGDHASGSSSDGDAPDGGIRARVSDRWEMDTLPHNHEKGDKLREWVKAKDSRRQEERRLQSVQDRIDLNAREGWQQTMQASNRADSDGEAAPAQSTHRAARPQSAYAQKQRSRPAVARPWHLRGVLPSSAEQLVQALAREEAVERRRGKQGSTQPRRQHAAQQRGTPRTSFEQYEERTPQHSPAAAAVHAVPPSAGLPALAPAGYPAGARPHIRAQSLMANPYLDPQRCALVPAPLPQQPSRPERLLPKGRRAAEVKLWWLQMQRQSTIMHAAVSGGRNRQGMSGSASPQDGVCVVPSIASPPMQAPGGASKTRKKRPGRKLKRKTKNSAQQ